MPEYILTGRDQHGRVVTDIVVADSADDAVRFFREDGHADVTLHTDDIAALFHNPSQVRKVITPREYVGYRTRDRLGCTLFMIRKMYVRMWGMDLLLALFLAARVWAGMGWGFLDTVAASVLLVPIPMAVFAELTSAAVPYRRVMAAVRDARWADAGRHLRRVRLPLPPFERPYREAQVLAGTGRLSEALDHYRPVADDPAVPQYVYWTHKGVLYSMGRDRGRGLECLARAADLAPANGLCQLNYALNLLTVRGDVRQARERIAQARAHALSDFSTPVLWFAEGVLALNERRPGDAVGLLEAALRALSPFTRGNPELEVLIARIRANLALALAAAGDPDAARSEYRKAEPLLARHDAPELARCREVLG
jgi:tetratricopeptide (TPR) repeat protein